MPKTMQMPKGFPALSLPQVLQCMRKNLSGNACTSRSDDLHRSFDSDDVRNKPDCAWRFYPRVDLPRLTPPFAIPAAFFYALGASLPLQMDGDQRYNAILNQTALTNAAELKSAVDSGVLSADSQALTLSSSSPPPTINSAQAVRRLAALGGSASANSGASRSLSTGERGKQ